MSKIPSPEATVSLDIAAIRVALLAIEHGSFRRVAAATGMPQPTVSRLVARLEDQVWAIRGRLMDAGFLMGPAETSVLDTATLWSETVRVALPRHHKFADRQTLSWADVRDERFLVPAAMHPPGVTAWLAGV